MSVPSYVICISTCNINLCIIDQHFAGGYADNEGDYTYQNYSFTFNSTDEEYPVIIRPIDDNIVEPDEYFTLVVSLVGSPAHFMIDNESATITIFDDDGKKLHT